MSDAIKRKGSPYWRAKYADAAGKRARRSTGTTDKREAETLEAKWKVEGHQAKFWDAEPS